MANFDAANSLPAAALAPTDATVAAFAGEVLPSGFLIPTGATVAAFTGMLLPGFVGGAAVTVYFLAAFDNLGFRYYWSDTQVSFGNAPTPTGTYVASTLVVEGRF